MTVWETEDESTGPTLTRAVSRSSRKSKRSITPPGKKGKSRSPPPLSGDKGEKGSKRSSRDVANDENISILDPRRFTPTLHASLVSEILSLRRDQEEKLKIIESLENSLQAAREESEALQASLSATGKESRSLKRQLSLLEGGTSSALGELSKERDEAIESAAEARKRLEALQKKLRSQEEDSERVHGQWAKEKEEWEDEKRKYERRIHVAETRLKAVLEEVAAFQAVQAQGQNGATNGPESDGEESVKDNNDAVSVRSMSLTNSVRFSVANSILKATGNSLADELGFEGGYDDDSDYGGRDSVLSKRHTRNFSRDSLAVKTHQRHWSTDSLVRPGSVARGKLAFNRAALEKLEDGIAEHDEGFPPAPKITYVDSGIQYSPPPSPKVVSVKPVFDQPPTPLVQRYERLCDVDSPPRVEQEIEANQRRKRVSAAQPLAIRMPGIHGLMVNGSSQTVDEPLSPPKTPKSPLREAAPSPRPKTPPPPPPQPVMVSVSTQTEEVVAPPAPLDHSRLALPMPIPSISIIPPTSRPSSPHEPLLPQLTKDFGCQVSLRTTVSMTSTSMQTEEIRVDQRLAKLPPHLHPSAITSRPSSPAGAVPETTAMEDSRQFTPVPGNLPPRNPRRLTSKRSFTDMPSSPPIAPSIAEEETSDLYPGNNDNGPLSSQKAPMRRPPRISSLFAGFDGNSSDEADEFMDAELSDSEYRTALSAPNPRSGSSLGGKRNSIGTVTSSENTFSPKAGNRLFGRGSEDGEAFDYGSYPPHEMRDLSLGRRVSRRGGRPSGFGTKSSVMRRAVMIQNGIASHQMSRSPSITDHSKEPPFPIPTRASSRKPPISISAPSDGRASPSKTSDTWSRRGSGRSHYRAGSIRKVRSTAVMPRSHRNRRRGSRSPPPVSLSTEAPESPRLPPLPRNDITTPRTRDGHMAPRYKSHRSQPSTTTANTAETGGASQGGGSSQAPTVVDAIAQTMVGEWMFKYVRRRKSFGVGDAKGSDDNGNDRHKRWVWLAPYERSILWSSKQPTSGSALLGKSGRKLVIQSVLDVKDDNPPPKGVTNIFNRSILILTPQRALKFTATSAERHYIWLTALSFLAHSNQAIPDTLMVPQPKPLTEQYELPKPKRRAIRDSIRLTKAKAGIKSDPITAESQPEPEPDSAPPAISTYRPPPVPEIYSLPAHVREMSRDAAEPPAIPRFSERAMYAAPVHGRKRSNTGGHAGPPVSFRGFSGPAGGVGYHTASNSTAGNSIMTAGSSDIYSNTGASAVTGSSAMTWATPSIHTSEASSRPSGPATNNFFDAIGTVRMEAFISPLTWGDTPYEQDDYYRQVIRRRSKELRRRNSRSSRQSRTTRATDDLDEWYLRDDPFRGF